MSSIELNATRDLLMHSICIKIIQISTLFCCYPSVYVSFELDSNIRNMIHYAILVVETSSFTVVVFFYFVERIF